MITFADAGAWGAVWADDDATLALAGGDDAGTPAETDGPALIAAAALTADSDDRSWSLQTDQLQLTISPLGPPITAAELGGFDQLCRVHGRWSGDQRQPLHCVGRRSSRSPRPDLGRFASLTDVSAWFGEDDGAALTALRPSGAVNHAGDLRSAALFAPGDPSAVAEPRLSVTYSGNGEPLRVGLELWLETNEEDELYPHRLACAAAGASLSWVHGDLELTARRMLCQGRRGRGDGIYLRARRR